VLVSHDSELSDYLQSFLYALQESKYHHAMTSIEGLAIVNALDPDLIIYDLDIPQPRAKETLYEIRQNHLHNKFIVLCSKPEEHEWIRSLGIDVILSRPFDYSTISQYIMKLIPNGQKSEKPPEQARLLVADDEAMIVELLNDFFSSLGVEVFTAKNGQDALKVFQEQNCNLAIVDLKMPKVGGEDLIRKMQKSQSAPAPKSILILTGALGLKIAEIKRLGFPVLTKPVDLDELERNVMDACDRFGLACHN